jgi:formate dehydrogenase beta subunit
LIYSSSIMSADGQEGDWQAVAPYKQPAYHDEVGLMAAGDHLTDIQAAIKAIASGRRAAVSIHNVLYELPLTLPDNVVTPDAMIQNVHAVSRVPSLARHIMPIADAFSTASGQELEKGFTREQAVAEANRCLRCGLICYLHQPPVSVADQVSA